MSYLSRFSPVPAYRDLRAFLQTRERYEFGFLALAVAITGCFVWAFVKDSHVEAPYKREIVYVQQWRADRTDAQIKAQQVVDQAAREQREAAQHAERERTRLEFKRLDDRLTKLGF